LRGRREGNDFSKIGISRFLKRNYSLRSPRLCGEPVQVIRDRKGNQGRNERAVQRLQAISF
ncbi:MAG: hypothetical protein WA974_00800, partial [Thermodesulfobacteriota bacterium]